MIAVGIALGAVAMVVAVIMMARSESIRERILFLLGGIGVAGWNITACRYAVGPLDYRVSALYLCAVGVAVTAWTLVSRRILDQSWWPRWWVLALAALEPALVAATALLPHREWERLFWTDGPWRHETLGVAYDIHAPYCIVVIAVGAAFLIRRAELARGADRWLTLATVLVPCVGVGGQLTGERIMQFAALAAQILQAVVFLRRNPDELAALVDLLELDPVTGAIGRSGLDRVLALAAERSRRLGTPLSVIVIDVDGFKGINDGHGHVAGDVVLRSVVARVHGAVGGMIVGRFGGDEFVAVLPGTGAQPAAELAGRVVDEVSGPVDTAGTQIRPAVSAGVASYSGGSVDELLRAADRAMYDAKRGGGNRVAIAGREAE